MTKQIDELLIQLADAIYADQHPETLADPVTGVKGPEYDAFELGEYIYSVQVNNHPSDSPDMDIFTQWPRLHRWIREQLDDHTELEFGYSNGSSDPDQILIKVNIPGSKIQRTAFLTREVMLDMLRERGVPEYAYSAASPITTLWDTVLAYECL